MTLAQTAQDIRQHNQKQSAQIRKKGDDVKRFHFIIRTVFSLVLIAGVWQKESLPISAGLIILAISLRGYHRDKSAIAAAIRAFEMPVLLPSELWNRIEALGTDNLGRVLVPSPSGEIQTAFQIAFPEAIYQMEFQDSLTVIVHAPEHAHDPRWSKNLLRLEFSEADSLYVLQSPALGDLKRTHIDPDEHRAAQKLRALLVEENLVSEHLSSARKPTRSRKTESYA